MQAIVLIPFIICLVALFRMPLPQVVLRVYLPVFVLLPSYYYWKIAALPPIDVAEAVLLPLGLGIVVTQLRSWKFTTTDLWMLTFLASTCVTNFQKDRTTAGYFGLFFNVAEGLIPYMIGKTLLEQTNLRKEAARRFVMLMVICCVISFYEYRMEINPFTLLWQNFFPDEVFAWKTQIRWGGGRVSGPYGQSELAGIIFTFAITLAIWVGYSYPWAEKFSLFPRHPLRKRTIIITTLVATLLLTQARGPWLGCLLAVPLALIGRSKRVLRNMLLFLAVLIPTATIGYIGFSRYTASRATSDEQQTAQYRSLLVQYYTPVAASGGAWGWGEKFPTVPGYESIDNEYLYIWLVQGWVGVGAFLIIALETLVRLAIAAVRSRTRNDRFFALSLLGAFAGILFTITTVFLGNQPFQLFFLCAGWAQALNLKPAEEHAFAFEHVLT